MKKIKILIWVLTILLTSNLIQAKENSSTTIPEKPKAGDEITIVYNPANTNLADAKNVEIIYSLYSRKCTGFNNIEDTHNLAMQKEGNNWTAKIKASTITESILAKFSSDDISDNNEGNGYFIRFYDKDGNETINSKFGYAAAFITWGTRLQYLNENAVKAYDLIKLLFASNPELKGKYADIYLQALSKAIPENERTEVLKKELKELEKSSSLTESDYSYISSCYKNLRMPEKEAETKRNAVIKYPQSRIALLEKWKELDAEKDINKQKEIAIKLHNDFPVFGNYEIRPMGYVLLSIVEKGKYEMLKEWWEYIKDKNWSGLELYNYYVDKLIGDEKGWETALEICRQGEELWNKESILPSRIKAGSRTESQEAILKKKDESSFYTIYAKILIGLKRDDEAVEKYIKAFSIYPIEKFLQKDIISAVQLLIAQKKYEIAQPIFEDAVRAGIQIAGMEEGLKEAYTKKNNNEKDFENYFNKLIEEGKEKYLANQKKQMINQPAPQFTLEDLDGKKVSLTDYKGKVVVVDFWATWCGPCRASFPAMQKAVNKYKNNSDVVFLFINTRQTEIDKKKNAQDFINETKYPFHVLLDIENKVITDFKVSGIPTKFIIDKNGNIRFKVVGFSGADDVAVEELSSMIELAGK